MMQTSSLRRSPLLLLAAALVAMAVFLFGDSVTPVAQASHQLDPPTNPAATHGNGSVTLTWDRTFNDDSYTVQYGEHPSGTLSTVITSQNVATHTISALTNGTTYRFQVKANGHSGHSDSAYTGFVTATPQAPVTLMSNAKKRVDTEDGGLHSTFNQVAQRFSTGANADGYILSSVAVLTDSIVLGKTSADQGPAVEREQLWQPEREDRGSDASGVILSDRTGQPGVHGAVGHQPRGLDRLLHCLPPNSRCSGRMDKNVR